jgi:hypothetical protein
MSTTDPVLRITDLNTAWSLVARQPITTMRWAYYLPIADLRDAAARRLIDTAQRRDPDAYVLLARLRPYA